MDDPEETARWLRLGYETYGPAGARAVAKAMGLPIAGTAIAITTKDR